MDTIKLSYATITYNDPIVNIVFKENTELGFLEIRELVSHSENLTGKKPYFTLSVVPNSVKVTPIGRKLAADVKEASLNLGSALVVHGVFMEVAANFYNSAVNLSFPFKVFTDKEKAREWLLDIGFKTQSMT